METPSRDSFQGLWLVVFILLAIGVIMYLFRTKKKDAAYWAARARRAKRKKAEMKKHANELPAESAELRIAS